MDHRTPGVAVPPTALPPVSPEGVLRERAARLRLLVLRLERMLHDAEERSVGLRWLALQEDSDILRDFPDRIPSATRASLNGHASELERTRRWIVECLREVIPAYRASHDGLSDDMIPAHYVADVWTQGLDANLRPINVPRYRPVPSVPQRRRYEREDGECPPWLQPFGRRGWARTKRPPIAFDVEHPEAIFGAPGAVN